LYKYNTNRSIFGEKVQLDYSDRIFYILSMEVESSLVGLPDFKSGVPSEEGGRWVRFPCTSAIIADNHFNLLPTSEFLKTLQVTSLLSVLTLISTYFISWFISGTLNILPGGLA
jgi:hypothetical protein